MADGTLFDTSSSGAARPQLSIALVNNMPDAALPASERQFRSLVEEAARGDFDVTVRLYNLPGLRRGEAASAAMAGRYGDLDELMRAGADALIVTGAEPLTDDLRAETYWGDLVRLVDWARDNTASSLWSCLAAHAAVLHLDGIERQPLAAKCSGVFTFERVGETPLTGGLPGLVRIPHSRRNTLDPVALETKGYHILTKSPRAGVDMFVRHRGGLFVFLQGHPEYDADSLLREYCRDVGRYLRGQQEAYPQSPFGYFDAASERSFRSLAIRARTRRDPQLISWAGEIAEGVHPARPWRAHAVALFRNWLELIATAKTQGRTLQRLPA
jgi:homoserine O-succinyltransferase